MGIFIFLAFGAGVFFGIVLLAVLSANTREDERDEAYKLGYRDGKLDRPSKIR